MIFLEVGDLTGLVVIILAIMFLPAIILFIIGVVLLANQKKKAGKILMILGVVYLLISLGICGSMMM
ncbi:hypothetical protein LS48_13635 [Aequorivita aquimaris]|uniref:Uncharacterized protein n=1 Tax=Aequorivita aquimaris TaxID=1548749 RepID=A0A137REV3_9FLAO|nr:hypothetical protein [Aequorivita aquimaris]KXN98024.1 hypothetical protein LS48_13635 [Aequorivita aquimaris]